MWTLPRGSGEYGTARRLKPAATTFQQLNHPESAGPVPALSLCERARLAQDARMPAPRAAAASFALLALLRAGAPAHAAEEVMAVYRCTDARGKVALRDRPCPDGQRETVREMQRIPDPPRPARMDTMRVVAPAQAPQPTPAPQYIVLNTPRPMYECVTPDNQRYTSESPEGNPRWVPLWTLDYPVLAERNVYRPGGASVRYRDGRVDARVRSGSIERRVVPTLAGYGAGTWVRDSCYALPQQETCERLRDRRDEVRRRAFNAQPSERARLDIEERGINARLSADCGGA
jgi:hypothetical protein